MSDRGKVLGMIDSMIFVDRAALHQMTNPDAKAVVEQSLSDWLEIRAVVVDLISSSEKMHAASKTIQNAYRKGRLPSESSRAVFGVARSKLGDALKRVK